MDDKGHSRRIRPPFIGDRELRLRAHRECLADLEQQTDPDSGMTAEDKDSKAQIALSIANDFVGLSARWALDHIFGLSLRGKKILAAETENARLHRDYLQYCFQADDHSHEEIGSPERDVGSRPSDPRQRRLILRNYLFAAGANLPPWLRSEVVNALDGLDRGETQPLFQVYDDRERRVRTAQSRLARAHLAIVAIARFRFKSSGHTLEEVYADIADQINGNGATIEGWDKRLRKGDVLGCIEYENAIGLALRAANTVQKFKKMSLGVEDKRYKLLQARARMASNFYDEQALAEAAAEWREADKAKG